MKTFAIIAAAAGLVAATKEHAKEYGTGAVKYTTAVVTAYTTYCPSSTQITHNGVTYTVTEATTLTISNCPCTVTKPVESYVTSSTVCYKPSASSAPVKPTSYFPSVPAPSNVAPSASAPPQYTGAASKAQVAGAGLLAVFGAAVVAL